jgi:four helix bundle protein
MPLEKPWDLRERSVQFAVAVIRVCRTLPGCPEAQEMGRQLRRSASSAAANYRAARRGKSHSDFSAKLGTAIEEADEALFWLDLLVRVDLTTADAVRTLTREANELVAIFTACQKTARRRR